MALIVKKYSTEPNPSLLLHMDGTNGSTTFIDSSLNNFTITPHGDAQIITFKYKFGGACGYFTYSNSNSYLTTNSFTNFGFGTEDFTIEMWAYKEYDDSYFHGIICINRYDDNGILFRYQPSYGGTDSLYVGNEVYDWNPVDNFPIEQWNHLALVRKDGVVSVYVNGNSVFSVTNTNDLGSSGTVTIGASSHDYSEIFNGYIDEVRIIKGYAAYTSNFTPPTGPFLNPSNPLKLIIKKNTIFKIPRTGSTAPAGIDVANTSAFVAEFSNLTPFNGKFLKNSASEFYLQSSNQKYLSYDGNWFLWDFAGKYPQEIYRNISATNSVFIPETGWGGSAKFYTGTSPTIPYSTNSFVVTSAVGQMSLIVGLIFTKIDANTWTASGGTWIIQGADLSLFSLINFDGKNYNTYSYGYALSSGIPTVGWMYSNNIVFTPQ
jgi:hypothetical protein